jgi:2-polyprenyl-6-methoxyphenol hydroxylase-like FAD-dependent oxidoreductase
MGCPLETTVLIAGAGPVGLALAVDLGRRGVRCVVLERNDGEIFHPRATAQNARTMEFFRRWGIAGAVKQAGTPPDFPHTVLYVTDLNGYEIARFERAAHGGVRPIETSPERPQRCNQLWLDPILHELAAGYDAVTLRYRCELTSFVERDGCVVATVHDRARDAVETITADYVVDCTGARGTLRRELGIEMDGHPGLDYNLSIFFRIPELWSYHDKGKAALHFFVDKDGISRNLIQLDGRELWRLGVVDKALYDDPASADVAGLISGIVGRPIPYELIGVRRWVADGLVARSFRAGRAFLAGDAAHLTPPSGGFGLNTGMGDIVDLGWKLAATAAGWGGAHLLDSYERERRPIAQRNVRQSTENHLRTFQRRVDPAIAEASEAGARARAALGDDIRRTEGRTFISDGTALGYVYADSPIVCPDAAPPPVDTIMEYTPTSYPGARAPHAWIAPGKSTVDLFGTAFVLLRLGASAPDPQPLVDAFAQRGVPLNVTSIDDPAITALYERNLVLVRPDGHVGWRSDTLPPDSTAIIDRLRGAKESS